MRLRRFSSPFVVRKTTRNCTKRWKLVRTGAIFLFTGCLYCIVLLWSSAKLQNYNGTDSTDSNSSPFPKQEKNSRLVQQGSAFSHFLQLETKVTTKSNYNVLLHDSGNVESSNPKFPSVHTEDHKLIPKTSVSRNIPDKIPASSFKRKSRGVSPNPATSKSSSSKSARTFKPGTKTKLHQKSERNFLPPNPAAVRKAKSETATINAVKNSNSKHPVLPANENKTSLKKLMGRDFLNPASASSVEAQDKTHFSKLTGREFSSLKKAVLLKATKKTVAKQPRENGRIKTKTNKENKEKKEQIVDRTEKAEKLSLDGNEAVVSGMTATSTTARPWNCTKCFKSEFPTLIDQPDLCATHANGTIDIVFLIATAVTHTSHRNAIRNTWALATRNNTANLRYVFMLGVTTDVRRMRMLEKEGRHFRDLLVTGFQDSYRNLTLKTITSLRWFTTRCRHARFFVKVDDDVWINSPVVLSLLRNHSTFLQYGLGGYCATANRVNRYNVSKWYVPTHLHPRDKYAPYCLGFAYAGSVAVAERVVAVSPDVPFFHLEDVYLGMCLERLKYGVLTFDGFRNFPHNDSCQIAHSPQVSTILNTLPRKMFEYWSGRCPL